MTQIMTDAQLNKFSIVWQEYLTERKVKELFEFWAPINAYTRASEYIEAIEPIIDLTNLEFAQYAELALNELKMANLLKFSKVETEKGFSLEKLKVEITLPFQSMNIDLGEFLMSGHNVSLAFAILGYPSGHYIPIECTINEDVAKLKTVKLLFNWRPSFDEWHKQRKIDRMRYQHEQV